jgi:hypothetical protein
MFWITIYPKITEEPHFECVRQSRTHSKCELLLNFRVFSKVFRSSNYRAGQYFGSVENQTLIDSMAGEL